MKFIRNHSLTLEDRATIGLKAINGENIYGTITDIAKAYGVSRPFVYSTKNAILERLASPKSINDTQKEKSEKVWLAKELMLVMRLCGKCSIESISESLRLLNYPYCSIGYVSEFLNLKSTCLIDKLPSSEHEKIVLADEIFACGKPILVIIDAHSHYILAIKLAKDRTGETWNTLFRELIERGYVIKKVVKDLGSGIHKGIEGLEFISQADLYHLLMKFDPMIEHFKRKAFGAIEDEERLFKVYNNRRTEEAENKALNNYFEVIDAADKRIKQYDNYQYLHDEIHHAFNPFDKDGNFRDTTIIKEDVLAALVLMNEEFPEHNKITIACEFLRKHIEEYFPYINDVKNVLKEYEAKLPEYQVKNICLAYQWYLKAYAVKEYQIAKKLKKEADELMSLSTLICITESEKKAVKELFDRLNQCVRSSSPLEAKNSILRKYINSLSGQVTQEHLNLIAFYLNRKVSVRGKYKGLSPIERETGNKENVTFLGILMNKNAETDLLAS